MKKSHRTSGRRAALDRLETRTLFAAAYPTPQEEYVLELVNQARANPTAEVQMLANVAGWGGTPDLNEGLPAGTLQPGARQPLAFNPNLVAIAQSHSQYMITNNDFNHNEGAITPANRVAASGYGPATTSGENIAQAQNTATQDPTATALLNQNGLFIDGTEDGRGHRINILNNGFNEFGAGIATGVIGGFNTNDLTEDFANAGVTSFLTGITYNDTNGDQFYEPGEELGGVTITATRTSDNAVFSTSSWASGGYSLALAPGTYSVTASGGNIGTQAPQMVTIGTQNVEADFLSTVIPPAAAPTIVTQPGNQFADPGSTATFTAAANGYPIPTVQWQVETPGTNTFTPITGATGFSLAVTASAGINGNQYQAVITNSQGSVTSTAAALAVNGIQVSITTSPVGQTVNVGDTVTFTSAATGYSNVQWAVSTDGGNTFNNIAGATSPTLTFTATADLSGNTYQVTYSSPSGSGSANAGLTVNTVATAPVITAQPTNATTTAGNNATLTVGTNAFPAPTVQWQGQNGAGTTTNALLTADTMTTTSAATGFTDIAGATGTTVSLPAPMTGVAYYRAVITNASGSVTSEVVKVFANKKAQVTNDLTTLQVAANAARQSIVMCQKVTTALVSRLTTDLRNLHATRAQKALLTTLASDEKTSRLRFIQHQNTLLSALLRAASLANRDALAIKAHPTSATLPAKLQTDLAALTAAAAASTIPANSTDCKLATATQLVPIGEINPQNTQLQSDVEAGSTSAENIGQALLAPFTIALGVARQLATDAQS